MTRLNERRQAIELRLQGKTYTEIKNTLRIPKSTLSGWLSNYSLTKNQLDLLKKNIDYRKQIAIEKTIETKRKKRKKNLDKVYFESKRKWIPLNKNELAIAGLFLYWGEGNKRIDGQVALNNTDPAVVKFTLFWLNKILNVPSERIKVSLHLYKDMNIKKELNFWSKELKIPLMQFIKPYIKNSNRKDIDQKGYGHGTCGFLVNNVRLKERIIMEIKAIADFYSKKI